MFSLRGLGELRNGAKRAIKRRPPGLVALVMAALAIAALFHGPPLSWLWGRTVVRAGSATFSVPSATGLGVVEHRFSAGNEVLRFSFAGYGEGSTDHAPVPTDRWAEPSSTSICDLRSRQDRVVRCPDNFFEMRFRRPTVWIGRLRTDGRSEDLRTVATIPIMPGIYAIAQIPLPLAERWSEVALDAVTHLRSMEASPAEQFYSRAGDILRSIVTAFGWILVFIPALLMYFPPLGLALLALVPAIWLSKEKNRLENTVAAAPEHELAGSRPEQEHRRRDPSVEPGWMNSEMFEFKRWEQWLGAKARALRDAGYHAELRSVGPLTPKPGCSFRLHSGRSMGQFDVWATGEADFDVVDATTGNFVHNVWGMILDDISFEGAFDDFLSRVMLHPTPGRCVPTSLRSEWFSR